jgi:hypothetical protein
MTATMLTNQMVVIGSTLMIFEPLTPARHIDWRNQANFLEPMQCTIDRRNIE